MKNFISENISYLVKKGKHKQDDFGLLFDLKKGVINQYLLGKSNPKIETIQRICEYFKISIDAFINTSLEETGGKIAKKEAATNVATNIEVVAKEIEIRDELIAFYKEKIESYENEKNTLDIITRIENKLDVSVEANQIVFEELAAYFELINLKEIIEKAKNINIEQKTKK